jgi:hypothetical protein
MFLKESTLGKEQLGGTSVLLLKPLFVVSIRLIIRDLFDHVK